jgi:xanthine/uracil permease
MMLFPNTNPYSGKMHKVKCFRNWMIDTATVLFDDNHNDLRALPKTVRLQLLVVLSFVWSTVFTVYFFSIATMLWGWVGLVIGHLAVVFAMYFTFKQFHKQPYKKVPDRDEPPMYDDVWGA